MVRPMPDLLRPQRIQHLIAGGVEIPDSESCLHVLELVKSWLSQVEQH